MSDEGFPTPQGMMGTVNIKRKVRLIPHLYDKEGNEIEISSLVLEIGEYTKEKLLDLSSNPISAQILPLIGEMVINATPLIANPRTSYILLAGTDTRQTLVQSSLFAFLMVKFIQSKGLKFTSEEIPMTDEEVKEAIRNDRINSYKALASLFGMELDDFATKLKSGEIDPDDIPDNFIKDPDDEDLN